MILVDSGFLLGFAGIRPRNTGRSATSVGRLSTLLEQLAGPEMTLS